MTDLRFLIVNSNMQHAQQIIHELQNRVSFDVFQDTKEKNIWGLLEGGKDDVYVYDRCGRLAYYIPFPLSIMNHEEGNLVTSAILATYYRSPCGTTCEKDSATLEDFLNNVDREENLVDTTTKESFATTDLYKENLLPNSTDSGIDMQQEDIVPKVNQSYVGYDYPTYDETLEDYDNNETDPKYDQSFFNSFNRLNKTETDAKEDNAFFNSLYSFFFNTHTTETPITNETISLNASSIELNEESNQIFVPLNISEHDHEQQLFNNTLAPDTESTPNPTTKPKPDRCAEADPSVCKNWSKKRLLRAHNCCSTIEDESRPQMLRFCKNFGKKRCKKIKTILKCCIKTALFETTTVPTEDEEDTVGQSHDEEVMVGHTHVEEDTLTTAIPPVTEVTEVVCCREVEDGKLCRVSEEPMCKLGEFLQEDLPEVEGAPTEEKIM